MEKSISTRTIEDEYDHIRREIRSNVRAAIRFTCVNAPIAVATVRNGQITSRGVNVEDLYKGCEFLERRNLRTLEELLHSYVKDTRFQISSTEENGLTTYYVERANYVPPTKKQAVVEQTEVVPQTPLPQQTTPTPQWAPPPFMFAPPPYYPHTGNLPQYQPQRGVHDIAILLNLMNGIQSKPNGQ